MRACILEGHDFSAWRREHQLGERPSSLPYGLECLSSAGLELRHSDITHIDSRAGRFLRSRDQRLPYGLRYRGALGQVLTAVPMLVGSDVCVSIFERHAEVYLALRRRLGDLLPPLALISCYLGHWLRDGDPETRRRAIALARGARRLTVFSSNQRELVERIAGVPAANVSVIPYGIDTAFYVPGDASVAGDPFALAVGRDSGRDWPTFLEAASRAPHVRFRFAAPLGALEGRPIPPNVEFLGEVDHPVYRSLLCDARFVVVPTHDFGYPTGQSVLLEAMASGAPVIVTETAAMRDYLNEGVRSYPIGDASALADEMAQLWEDPETCRALGVAARRVAERDYSTERMWAQALPTVLDAAASRPGSATTVG